MRRMDGEHLIGRWVVEQGGARVLAVGRVTLRVDRHRLTPRGVPGEIGP